MKNMHFLFSLVKLTILSFVFSMMFHNFLFTSYVLADEKVKQANIIAPRDHLSKWKNILWLDAQKMGIGRGTFHKAVTPTKPNYKLPRVRTHKSWAQLAKREKLRKARPIKKGEQKGEFPASCFRPRQKEFLFPTGYFPPKHIRSLVNRGKSLRKKYGKIFKKIEAEYGVDIRAVLGIWGRETAFGVAKNRYDGIKTWISLAYAGPPESRKDHRANLLRALKFIDQGHVSIRGYKTSFAGATGYPQFTPDVFEQYAVDFDGDGRKNIWSSVPDAVASAAKYLKGIGWQSNQTWGYEVTLPNSFDCSLEGPLSRQTISDWKKLGVRRVADSLGQPQFFPDDNQRAQFMAPAGMKGPKFVVFENFEVFRRYNKADLYALFVGHLGDLIWCDAGKSACSFTGKWPLRDEFNFSRKNICEMQIHLKRLAASDETPDGLFGGKTRRGIGNFEKIIGTPQSCFPTRRLLKVLQEKTAPF